MKIENYYAINWYLTYVEVKNRLGKCDSHLSVMPIYYAGPFKLCDVGIDKS